jgi:hypothetical protein
MIAAMAGPFGAFPFVGVVDRSGSDVVEDV